MCGLNGFTWDSKKQIQQMNESIRHRGPDGEGMYTNPNISLGHLRLSILDLSPAGHQPMFYDKNSGASSKKHNPENRSDSPLILIFNGEIYNFRSIKQELATRGYSFTTQTDSEVIPAAYDAWGTSCVERFHGMWAFALFDQQRNQLFCSRDRFGKKPFFYYHNDDKFVFSSEIKGILSHDFIKPEANHDLISDYLYHDLVKQSDETFFEDIYSLEPSHNLQVDLETNSLSQNQYYELNIKNDDRTLEESQNTLDERLEQSVEERMVSDVPVGLSLSGGIDSTTLAGYLNESGKSDDMNAFTLSFDSTTAEDETAGVQNVLSKYPEFQLNKAELDKESFFDSLKKLVWHQEEPTGLSSLYVRYMIANEVNNRDMKVLMTGEGADEVFSGYTGYFSVHLASLLKQWKPRSFVENLSHYLKIRPAIDLLLKTCFLLLPTFLKSIYLNYEADNKQSQGLKIDSNSRRKAESLEFESLNEYLYDRTVKGSLRLLLDFNDKMGMAHSIESRSPFVDYRLIELAFETAEDKKMRNGYTKYLLRLVGERFVPEDIIWNKEKEGFPAPTEDFLMSDDFTKIIYELFENPVSSDLIDGEKIIELFQQNQKQGQSPPSILMKCVFLEIWFRQFDVNT